MTDTCYLLRLIYFPFNIVNTYGVVLSCYQNKFSFSQSFFFPRHVQVFSCEISFVRCLKYLCNCFSSHFCFLVVVLLIIILSVLFLVSIISLCSFLHSLRVVVLMHPHYLQCCQVLFFLLFLTRRVYLYHLSDVRPYTSSLIFLSLGPFVWVLPSSILRMVMTIIQVVIIIIIIINYLKS